MDTDEKTTDKDKNFAKLREKIERLEADNAKLRARAVDGVVHQAGFDPTDPIATLVREKWESDVEDLDDLKPETFAEFAGKFGLEPQTGSTEQTGDDEDGDEDLAGQIEAAQKRQREARGDAPGSKTPEDEIAAAEAEGDFQTSFMKKISQLPTAKVS